MFVLHLVIQLYFVPYFIVSIEGYRDYNYFH